MGAGPAVPLTVMSALGAGVVQARSCWGEYVVAASLAVSLRTVGTTGWMRRVERSLKLPERVVTGWNDLRRLGRPAMSFMQVVSTL